jgi:hypothetical protein
MLMNAKGIHKVRRKLTDGRYRFHYYAWRGGPKFWTSDYAVKEPVPDAFKAAYDKAVSANDLPVSSANNSFTELIGKFKAEAMPKDASTRETYDRAFVDIQKKFGPARIAAFTDSAMRQDVKSWHRSFAANPRAADMRLGALVRLLNFAKDEGLITGHCADNIARLHKTDRANIIWEPQEIERFCQGAPFPLWLGIQFMRLSGLRRGDAIEIPLSADKGQWLEWKTSKSGRKAEVVVPIVRELRSVLDAGKRHRAEHHNGVKATTILFNSRGQPWTASGFSTSFDKRKAALGIDKHLHDLRGTAATVFMGAGMTDEEIAEIMGWRTEDVRAIRRRYVSRAAIVSAAIARLERNAE